MAVLYFSGDQVAFFGGINDTGAASEFSGVNAPFLASDIVEIEIPDRFILADGTFDPNEVEFTRVTVVRDGIRHDFNVGSGQKIKETGGAEIPEAGDTFFTTNDAVGPPSTGPFSGLPSEKMVFATSSTFASGQNTTIPRRTDTDLNNDGDSNDAGEAADAQFNTMLANMPLCFAPGTLIGTSEGLRPVENLRPGDLVLTRNHSLQPVLWVRSEVQALEQLEQGAFPVLIKAGALGRDRPRCDLVVSPHHRVLVGADDQLDVLFEQAALVPAKALTMLPGIRHVMGRHVARWITFACARHEVVWANGCWCESLLLGRMAQRALRPAERAVLVAALGRPVDPEFLNGRPILPCLTVGHARRILSRVGQRYRARSGAWSLCPPRRVALAGPGP